MKQVVFVSFLAFEIEIRKEVTDMNNKMILIKTDKVLSSVESIQRGREVLFYSSVSPEKTVEANREGKAS